MSVDSARILNINDIDDIIALYIELVGEEEIISCNADRIDGVTAILEHPGTFMIGAEYEGEVVSMLTLHLLPNFTRLCRPYAVIENVVTKHRHQRSGFGRRVMDYAIALAEDSGAYKIMLQTGLRGEAVGFYKKLGFKEGNKLGLSIRSAAERIPLIERQN
ncbi:GNAT family N-acetyltransferase [Polycladidibacter stylochi]|uniref:GNAT family N-acetyltransferase n=1 Tax=Polycladidibacter stylochi TaxID=1807766 RepID=UPI000830C93A|nr:GNAT family N-acetyltransferase [Pseudovibrio stylochi]